MTDIARLIIALLASTVILEFCILLWADKAHQEELDTLRDWLTRCPDCGRVMDCICESCERDE